MAELTDEQKLAAWRAYLFSFGTVMRSLESEMQEEQDLLLTWYEILAHLNSAENGQMRMQELAESTLFSRSGLTRIIDRMDDIGLVTRQPCPEDRRGMYAVITDEGRAALESAMPGHVRGIRDHFLSHMSDDDIRALHRALSKVLDAEISDAPSCWWRIQEQDGACGP